MNEEFEKRWERKVEFILNQQAQSEAETLKLKVAQAETQKKMENFTEMLTTLTRVTFDGFKVLSDAQKLTDEQLRKLIARFDRHLSEDHGLEN